VLIVLSTNLLSTDPSLYSAHNLLYIYRTDTSLKSFPMSARNVTVANSVTLSDKQTRCNVQLLVLTDAHLRTLTPSFFITPTPCSSYSARVIQNSSRSFMISARTAPPRNTMCFRRGGSSMRILNFYNTNHQ